MIKQEIILIDYYKKRALENQHFLAHQFIHLWMNLLYFYFILFDMALRYDLTFMFTDSPRSAPLAWLNFNLIYTNHLSVSLLICANFNSIALNSMMLVSYRVNTSSTVFCLFIMSLKFGSNFYTFYIRDFVKWGRKAVFNV